MGVPRPTARGDSGLSTRISRLEADLEQLRRLITRPRKTPAAAVAAGGVNVAATVAEASTAEQSSVGSDSNAQFTGWTFSQGDNNVIDGPALTASDSEITVPDAGCYCFRWVHLIQFPSGAPSSVEANLNLSSIGYEPRFTVPVSPADGVLLASPGARVDQFIGPIMLAAGEVVRPVLRWGSAAALTTSSDVAMFLHVLRLSS